MSNQAWKKITILFLTIFLVLSSSLPSLGLIETSAKENTLSDEITEYTKISLSEKMEELIAQLESEQSEKTISEIRTKLNQYIQSDNHLAFNRVSGENLIESIKNLIPKLKDEEQQKEWTLVALALNKIAMNDLSVIVSADTTQAKKVEAKQTQAKNQYEQAVSLYKKENYNGAISHVNQSFNKFFDTLKSIQFNYKLNGDSDQDGLLDIEEFVYQTNPLKVDSDGDSLTDSFEIKQSYTNPVKSDSNDNGIFDDKEDPDKDGLSNKEEQTLKTNPLQEDSDVDKLNDGYEIKAGTNPSESDTDQDKLMDGEEDPLGFDPTKKDTNGNGIIDGDEIVSVTTTPDAVNKDENVVPSVTISSPATDSGTTTITNLKDRNSFLKEEIPGYLGSAYDFETDVEFDEAKMTFTYDSSIVTENFRPEIFYYNEAEQRLERLENQTHDPEKHTVTTKVTHFSSYLLLNGVEWDKAWNEEVGLPSDRGDNNNGDIQYLDIVFAIDSSGSMSSNDPNELRKDAVKSFIDTLLEKDKGAVVDFDSSARVVVSLTSDKQALKVAVDTIDDIGGTNIYRALNTSLDEVLKGQNSKKYVILLTDGEGTWNDSALQRAIDNEVTVYTIGLGSSIDVALLQKIANQTGGKYYHASTADELDDRFGDVADDTTEDGGKDTDSDGLPDSLEINGIRVGNGQYITTDPNNEDSDGDGLFDGEELIIKNYDGNQYATMVSDPNKLDSDNDSLIDTEEIQYGTDPLDTDSDGDTLNDSKEIWAGFDPLSKNPDNDQYPDAEELKNGTSPFIYDETAWEFGQNLLLGALWGDGGKTAVDWGIISQDTYNSVAYLSGQVLSGLVAIGDIRDAIGNIANEDPWGVVLSLVGIVPAVGDATKIIDDIIGFAKRTSNNYQKAVYFVEKILRKIDNSIADDALRKLAGACSCFIAGTLVLTDDGEKPIEQIEVGDQVLSKNEETGETAYKEVTKLIQTEKDTTYRISVGDQVVETTNNHPFWVVGKGWIFGEDLQVGDKLQRVDGNILEIKNIEIVQHEAPVKVYNFTVADFHTYYVSDLGIWVHNEGACEFTIKWGIHTLQVRPYGKGYLGPRIPQSKPRVDAFEIKINPNNESFYLPLPTGGYAQFENVVNNVVQDGKLILSQKSYYHVEDMPSFAREGVLKEARRQIDAARASEYKVEWLVSNQKAVEQLTRLFRSEGLPITVKYYPE